MEGIGLTTEQIEAVAAEQLGDGSSVYYTYVSNEDSGNDNEETQVVATEGQEVLVYDEETGEYQKCIYIAEQDQEEQISSASRIVTENPETNAIIEEERTDNLEPTTLFITEQNGESEAITIENNSTASNIDIQSLIESGSLSIAGIQDSTVTENHIVTEENQQPQEEIHHVVEQEQDDNENSSYLVQSSDGEHIILNTLPEGHEIMTDDNGVNTIIIHQQVENSQLSVNNENLNQNNLNESAIVESAKTNQKFKQNENDIDNQLSDHKYCSICKAKLSKQEHLNHYKEHHNQVRLGCPKCTQNYHSLDLLNIHYKHSHMTEDSEPPAKTSRILMKSQSTNDDMDEHINDNYKARSTKKPKVQPDCQVCLKTFSSQRDFANHRRRKGFCRPPAAPTPPQKRRIGIIRKSL